MAYFSPTIAAKRAISSGERATAGRINCVFMWRFPAAPYLTRPLRSSHVEYVLAWRRGMAEPIVDGFPEAFARYRHHRNGVDAGAVQLAQIVEQICGGFDQLATIGQVEDHPGVGRVRRQGRSECQQRLSGCDRDG